MEVKIGRLLYYDVLVSAISSTLQSIHAAYGRNQHIIVYLYTLSLEPPSTHSNPSLCVITEHQAELPVFIAISH